MISLNGIYGSTDEKELINSSDPTFLPGSAETFSLNARDVGALSTVSGFRGLFVSTLKTHTSIHT